MKMLMAILAAFAAVCAHAQETDVRKAWSRTGQAVTTGTLIQAESASAPRFAS